ncbi:MAG: efflux transporter outer membrane subunit [Tepidisphaeraceae bacterium]|jgi:NodT family efflux transporter outer membrane factor (OMF) lipoprotein
MTKIRATCVLALAGVVSGCSVGPNYHTPSTTMPSAYAAASTQPSPVAQPAHISRWWRAFNDPELDSLIDRAIAANFDLDLALTRLQEARTMEVAVEGPAFPVLGASGAAARGSGTNSTKGRISPPLNAASNTTGLKEITQIIGFDAGWELDLFGRYRRQIEAAQYDTQAAAETRNAVLITVVSDVARAYTEVRALQMRLKIANDNIDIERTTVDVVQQRFDRGLTNELDLALAKRQLATLQSEIAPLVAEISAVQRRLAVLLGEYPEDLTVELQQAVPLPQLPRRIQSGLPLDLLRRRPDIRQAERELAANTALVGARTADLFPRLAITAGAGLQGQGMGRPPAGNTFIWSAGPTAYWPLLDFGALDALIEIQDLRTHEALVNYRKTIVNAVEEVDDALSAYSAQQDRLQNLTDALAASQRAVTLANQRYNRGLTDFLNVTDAERQLYELQDQYAIAQEDVVVQCIAIYKGLGGGWQSYQQIPPIRKPLPAVAATVRQIVSPDHPEK